MIWLADYAIIGLNDPRDADPTEEAVMQTATVHERICTCPSCYADNTLVSFDIDPGATITCYNCGKRIGVVADMREAHVPLEHRQHGIPAD